MDNSYSADTHSLVSVSEFRFHYRVCKIQDKVMTGNTQSKVYEHYFCETNPDSPKIIPQIKP